MAALPTQIEIQYPQATMKAARGPNAACAYAYGPPALGYAWLKVENTTASNMAPAAVNNHASRLLMPKGASAAGSRNTPDPIELPTTSAVHIQNPSNCGRAPSAISDLVWWER